jgi:hypothetical protein
MLSLGDRGPWLLHGCSSLRVAFGTPLPCRALFMHPRLRLINVRCRNATPAGQAVGGQQGP